MIFNRNRVRTISYKLQNSDLQFLVDDWKTFVTKIPKFPKRKFNGRGIVYSAGGISSVTCVWVSINRLRSLGCTLPIEIWHLGNELSKDVKEFFTGLNINFRDFQDLGSINRTGVFLKPLAILHSSFREVLYIDADNVCLKDPSYLFDIQDYKQTGTIFWPDYWLTDRNNPIWEIVDSSDFEIPEQESGQILINKEVCWKELNLCLHFNMLEKYYYNLLYGDKDTFKFAWIALKTHFYMIPSLPGCCGKFFDDNFYSSTIVQYDHLGDILFLHRNLLKWDITQIHEKNWTILKCYVGNASKKEATLIDVDGRPVMDIGGDVENKSITNEIILLEEQCLTNLRIWRDSKTYFDFYEHLHFMKHRYSYAHYFSLAV